MNRKILITGASGNVGAKLRTFFAQAGYELVLLDIDSRADAQIHEADLATWSADWVQRFVDVDTVIHLAGATTSRATWAQAQRLNIDMTANVYAAAIEQRVRRVVFASTNWVMVGHRFGSGPLTTEMDPHPINAYGASKLAGERMGRLASVRQGLSVICLRIGYLQLGENLPGTQMGWGSWGQAMWLSNRDLCHAMERAVLVEGVDFAVLNLMSDNPGMRWDIETTKRVLGYAPRDGAAPVITDAIEDDERKAAKLRTNIDDLEAVLTEKRW